MAIALVLKKGSGALFPNPEWKEGSKLPKLIGTVAFDLDDKKDGRKLRLEAGAWIKEKDGKPFYSLSVGGISASLFPEKDKKTDESADYTGTFGNDRELRFAGWKKIANGTQDPYVSVSIDEKKSKNASDGADSKGDNQAPSLPRGDDGGAEMPESSNFDFV